MDGSRACCVWEHARCFPFCRLALSSDPWFAAMTEHCASASFDNRWQFRIRDICSLSLRSVSAWGNTMNQPIFNPSGAGPSAAQPAPWPARVSPGSTHDLEAMHRQAVDDLAGCEQAIARLEAEAAQAHTDRRAAGIRVKRLGDLMDELRGMHAAPAAAAAGNFDPVAEAGSQFAQPVRPLQRSRQGHLVAMTAVVVLVVAAAAVLAVQTRYDGDWHRFVDHAATRIQSGAVSLR